MVRIRVLGATEISIGHRRIGMNTEVQFALALYLTTRAGERIAREELLERFWTKGSAEDRRHALRQMLYRLRQKGLTLDDEGEWILLDPSRIDSDLRDALSDGWVEKADEAAIDAAATFTPSFSSRIAPPFLEWLDEVRERVAAHHRRAALRQINVARREARWADLDRWALPVLRSDPLNEEATLARAESAAMAGSKTMALEILDTYLQEVGEISPDLGRPASQLRKRLAERRPDWATRGPKEVPLIGRADLVSRLTGLVEAAWRGEGSAVVLVGAPGIGKTRLAMEARAYAELKGMRTVVVRAEVGNSERPFAALQTVLGSLLGLPGAVGCDPESLALLRRIVERGAATKDHEVFAAVQSARHRLPSALRELCNAITHEVRVLIVLDDVHNCDNSSVTLLRHLIISTTGTRFAWIGTSRRGTGPLATTADIAEFATPIGVSTLSEDESHDLADRTARAHNLALSLQHRRAIAHASAGNPLFVRELSLSRADANLVLAVPESLQSVISDRLDRLPAVHLHLLRVIALLGGDSTPSTVHAVGQVDRALLSRALESLEQDGLLSFAAEGHFELHECWHRAVLDTLSGTTKAVLSFECASALVSTPDRSSKPDTLWRAAELFRDAGESAEALRRFVEAADRLFSAGLPGTAADVLRSAAPLATEPPQRLLMAARTARALLASGSPQACLEATEDLAQLWSPSSPADRINLSLAVSTRAEALSKLRLPHSAQIDQLAQLASDELIPPDHRQLLCATGIRLAAKSDDRDRERKLFRLSTEIASQHGRSVFRSIVSLVFHSENGSLAELHQAQADALVADADDIPASIRCQALRMLCTSLRIAGRIEEAIEVGTRAYAIAKARALSDDARIVAQLLAFTLLDEEDVVGAENWIDVVRECDDQAGYVELSTSIGHVLDRIQLQRGNGENVVARLLPRIDEVLADPLIRSRASELATLIYSATLTGRNDLASRYLPATVSCVQRIAGVMWADYSTELVARVLLQRGQPEEANRIVHNHLRRRHLAFRRPLARFCSTIREMDQTLSAEAR